MERRRLKLFAYSQTTATVNDLDGLLGKLAEEDPALQARPKGQTRQGSVFPKDDRVGLFGRGRHVLRSKCPKYSIGIY